MAKRAAKPSLATRLVNVGLRPRRVLVLAAVVGVLYGGYALWQHVAPQIRGHEQYRLDVATISLTPTPSWIRSDVKADVLHDANFDQDVSLLDDDLTERLANAFALHPWVAKVLEVRKTGAGGVYVEVEYRQPVCMVEVPRGLYAVDAEGVLLPSGDFLPVEARRYPRLSGAPLATAGPVGTRWPDVRVVGAAEIAAALGDRWRDFDLNRIVPASPTGETSSQHEPDYELFTALGTRVIWGKAPHVTTSGEPSVADKVARLTTYAGEHGTLDGASGPQDIDLRARGGLIASPRMAAADDETSDAGAVR